MSKYNNFVNFVSNSSIKAKEEENSQARKLILEKAKAKYEAEERREQKKKKSGEGTWMLDTVSKRIQKEQKIMEDTKSKGKKKKKKEKKKKKKHHRHSDSSPSSESEEEDMWVESKTVNVSQPSSEKLQRDSWMELPMDLLPAISRKEIRDEANREKQKAKMEAEKHLQPGQHERELNPYWKNGGSGLPSAQQSSTSTAPSSSTSKSLGDGGLTWLLKSLSRMKEQAKEDGRSLEDIATERYGSLDRLMSMIREAEKSQGRGSDRNRRDVDRRDGDREGKRDFKQKYSDSREKYRGRDTDGKKNIYRDRESGKNGEDKERGRQEGRNNSSGGSGFRRPGPDDDSESRRDDRRNQESRNSSGQSNSFRRPNSGDESEGDIKRDRHRLDSRGSSGFRRTLASEEENKRMFRRPGDGDDEADERKIRNSMESYSDEIDRHERQARKDGWRKSPQKDDSGVPRWKRKSAGDLKHEQEVEKRHERSRRKSSSSESSTSSDDEKQEYQKKKVSETEEEPAATPPTKVMSEIELNDLAAKVLRAEIMGDETLASQLKATMEEARRVRESSKATEGKVEKDFVHSKRMERDGRKDGIKEKEQGGGDENVVVLSRTNKAGMVRPVLPSSSSSSAEWGGRSAGRKRKRKNAATHSDSGERTKFFHDDDKYDLKSLVEREKAGTAEDQNSMFARLAGREKDRDLDVDDMFVSKAARGQQEEEEEAVNRDKMAAITEHRKRSSAMEKCTRCFDKVPKHLIVAIGRKSYLCLPDHASLTEGHCLIVPMAHTSSATSMDEDVWQDMQQFRKSIVQMFQSQEKDVVFMETVMYLKHFPHTAVECIPLECEVGDLSPIYFKKALQEVGPEWSQNKKVHDLSKKDVRHTIPKGFPYFSVDFGLQGGFAHAIEDEATFSSYFGREIVGGMLDTEPGLWRKPRKQNFEDQRQKVLQFEQWWSPFDWTQDIG